MGKTPPQHNECPTDYIKPSDGEDAGDKRNAEKPFIAIAPRSHSNLE